MLKLANHWLKNKVKIEGIYDKLIKDCMKKQESLISDIEDKSIAAKMAILLENMSLMHEMSKDNKDLPDVVKTEEYKNRLLELTKETYHPVHFLGWHLVNVHPFISPNNLVHFKKYVKNPDYDPEATVNDDNLPITIAVESDPAICRTRKLKEAYMDDFGKESGIRMRDEITREILTDLRNNAGTVATWNPKTVLAESPNELYESLYIKFVELSGILHRKTMVSDAERWIVVGSEVGKFLIRYTYSDIKPSTGTSPYYAGTLNSAWKLYIDPLFPSKTILMGLKDHQDPPWGSYFYCPYIGPVKTPEIRDPEFCPRVGWLVRYSKKLFKEGARYYAKLELEDLPE